MPKRVVFPELEAGLARKGIRKTEVSNLLHIMTRTLSNKLNGVSHFTVEEAIKIHKKWFNDIPIEELFREE